MADLFRGLRRALDRDERVLIAAPPPGLRQAKPLPSPSELLVTDAEQATSLRQQLDTANAQVARLEAQLLKPAPEPTGDRHCPNCAGMERTVRQVEQERGDLRRKLAGYELAATRDRQVHCAPPAT